MTNLVPGFIWHPIDVSGRARRAKGRGLIAHVAVSESTNLVPSGTPATRSADWHFYLPKVGPGIQYIDLDYQCWSSAGANATCPAFESQGGVNSPQTEPWTANQIENAAQILAHLHRTEGTPLQVMPNSLPSSKGIAPHRWGINPWRVSGGEVWSSSNGKVCPGDAKVAQLPLIVSRAAALVSNPNGDISMADAQAILDFLQNTTGADLRLIVQRLNDVRSAVVAGDGAGPGNNFAWLYNQEDPKLNAILAALGKVQTPVIDEAKLATALLADPAAVQALGKAIADNLQLTPRASS